jgi:hypothetical protein
MNKQQIENILTNHAHQIERYDLTYNGTEITIAKADDGTGSNKIVIWVFSRWWDLPSKTLDTSSVGINVGVVGGYSSGDQVYAFFNETETRFIGYGLLPYDGDPTLVSSKYKRLYPQNKENYQVRNYIINGNLEIWQRGTSFAPIGNGNYCADRIRFAGNGSFAITASQNTDVPSNSQFNFLNYSLKLDCTTAEASVGSSEFAMIDHRIEGYNITPVKDKMMALSFWVKSNIKTGTMGVSISHSASWGYHTTININQASTWERKIVRFKVDTSSGTWNYDNTAAIDVRLCLMAGSNFQSGDVDQWNAGNYLSTSSQTNFLDSTANDIYFAGFQLIEGEQDLIAKPLSIEEQVEQCQRYYEKSYNLTTDPGTNTVDGQVASVAPRTDDYLFFMQRPFKTRKRGDPTITWYSTSGTANAVNVGGSDMSVSQTNDEGEASHGYPELSSNASDGDYCAAHFTADAEL